MDTTMLIIFILVILGAIVSLIFGIKFLIKYNSTRKKLYLFLGVVLTFVIPTILLFIAFRLYVRLYISTSMIYGPIPA